MKFYQVILAIFFLISSAEAKTSFTHFSDMCSSTGSQSCDNVVSEVKDLQKALNSDKSLDTNLTTDGKWGSATKSAVIKFQKKYSIKPAMGYVGTKTKAKLAKIYKSIKLTKSSKSSKSSSKSFSGSYAKFVKNTNLRKSYKVYRNNSLLKRANRSNTRLEIDISKQRTRLYVNNKVALDTPSTTGAKRKFEPNTKIYRDKRTPLGKFKITEKIADKRSTIFGVYTKNGRTIYRGDKRKFKGSKKGLKYKGASLKNWMRLTSSGIGLHGSKYIKRHPGTNGCIRLPYDVAKTIFSKVKRGTKVEVVR